MNMIKIYIYFFFQYQAELRIHPPTLGDDTIQSHHTFNDNTEDDALNLDLGGGDYSHDRGGVHGHNNGHQADDGKIRYLQNLVLSIFKYFWQG